MLLLKYLCRQNEDSTAIIIQQFYVNCTPTVPLYTLPLNNQKKTKNTVSTNENSINVHIVTFKVSFPTNQDCSNTIEQF